MLFYYILPKCGLCFINLVWDLMLTLYLRRRVPFMDSRKFSAIISGLFPPLHSSYSLLLEFLAEMGWSSHSSCYINLRSYFPFAHLSVPCFGHVLLDPRSCLLTFQLYLICCFICLMISRTSVWFFPKSAWLFFIVSSSLVTLEIPSPFKYLK